MERLVSDQCSGASVVFSDLYLSDVRHEFIKDRWIKADFLEDKK